METLLYYVTNYRTMENTFVLWKKNYDTIPKSMELCLLWKNYGTMEKAMLL